MYVLCTFECIVWRACKAPSRVQWYSKLHPLVISVCFFPCGVRVRPPLVFSGTQKLTLSCSGCFFSFLFSCRPHTRAPSKRETKQNKPFLRPRYTNNCTWTRKHTSSSHNIRCRITLKSPLEFIRLLHPFFTHIWDFTTHNSIQRHIAITIKSLSTFFNNSRLKALSLF